MKEHDKLSVTQEVGRRIRRFRLQAGLTQEELAEKADLHHTYIGQAERGEKNLTLFSMDKILSALDISFSEFFEKVEDCHSPESPAAKCYQIISGRDSEEQSTMLHIIQEIDNLMKRK